MYVTVVREYITHIVTWKPAALLFFFSVRLLSVLRGHSVCLIPVTTVNDLRLQRISIPDLIHYIYFHILFLEKNSTVFPFSMLSAKQRELLSPFFDVFGMTRSLTRDCTRDIPHSKPALYH